MGGHTVRIWVFHMVKGVPKSWDLVCYLGRLVPQGGRGVYPGFLPYMIRRIYSETISHTMLTITGHFGQIDLGPPERWSGRSRCVL